MYPGKMCNAYYWLRPYERLSPPILLSRVKRINKGYNSLGLQIAHQKDYSSNTSTL
jgi:hypothetical protein